MEVPADLTNQVAQNLNIECDAAIDNSVAAYRRKLWAVVLGLVPKQDGDQWCVLWGKDLQSGIAAFGDTPEAAMIHFDAAMRSKTGAHVCKCHT